MTKTKLTVDDVYDQFEHKATDIPIKNTRHLTRSEVSKLRRVAQNKLFKLTCTNDELDPYQWAIILIRKKVWIEHQMKKKNKVIMEAALATEKAAAADDAARALITIDSAAVVAAYTPNLLDKNSAEVQMPEYDKKPGKFKINPAWTEKQMNKYKIEHDIQKEEYEEFEIIN